MKRFFILLLFNLNIFALSFSFNTSRESGMINISSSLIVYYSNKGMLDFTAKDCNISVFVKFRRDLISSIKSETFIKKISGENFIVLDGRKLYFTEKSRLYEKLDNIYDHLEKLEKDLKFECIQDNYN
tara:strand:+ start:254 stop:637 length:384 start_codon:yes stop_codon:yes gene_type:complete